MNYTRGKRIGAMLLAICLIVSMFVPQVEVEANALSVSSLTCSAYISNATARSYIDVMMKYYINNNTNLQNMLTTGKCVVFMFEGGSDNYWNGETYEKSLSDNRIQAVVFVVKADASGNAYIDYCSETCSSIASNVLNCTAGVGYSGSTTILDGVYRMYRWNHTGPYASFQLDVNNSNANGYGLYTPSSVPDGQLLGCSGINVHTRSTTSGSNWSAGCQVIGTGAYTSNEYNQFFRHVTGFNFDPWVNYYSSPKTLYAYGDYGYGYGSSYTVGYYVVDRQLAMIGRDGTKYGSGSLINVFNKNALSKLTSYSTPKAEAAGALNFEYASSQCTYYPSHCQIKVTLDGAPVNSQPCSVSTAYNSSTLETAAVGKTYTATGLYKNHYGNYWYRVTTSAGKTGYIYAGETQYIKHFTSDVTLSGATAPNAHVQGLTFPVSGTISSTYNEMTAVSCFVYSGYSTSGNPVTGTAAAPGGTSYKLAGSTVDNATAMNELASGKYTYQIQAAFRNYYATSATTVATNVGTLELMRTYFMIIPSSVVQATCSHSYETTTLDASNCTESGTKVQSCTKCGLVVTTAIAAGGHSYGAWTTTKEPTCTAAGTKTRTCATCKHVETQTIAAAGHSYGDWVTTTESGCNDAGVQTKTCSKCGDKQTQALSALGHDYDMVTLPATCTEYAMNEYTCGRCGDSYKEYADGWSDWSATKPAEGIPFETKTQYRYSDYETKTSYDTSMSGYTQKSSTWVQAGNTTMHYVTDWPSGYDTSHSNYAPYNRKPVSAGETATQKIEVNSSGTLIGYVYYHWCYGTYTEGPINRSTSKTKTDTFNTFHSFVASLATANPATLPTASDGSVTFANASGCTDSHWWYPIPIYEQKYTTYNKQFTYERWTDWSAWSDTPATASDTRKVETQTVYRYLDGDVNGHDWVKGVCAKCGEVCQHSFDATSGFCVECGLVSPDVTYYLTGTINGVEYTGSAIAADPDSPLFNAIRFDEYGVLDITLTEAITNLGIYCYMREGGNTHEGSFASYSSYTAPGDLTFWVTYSAGTVNNINMDWHVHEWDAGTVVTGETCTDSGVMKHTCTGNTVDGHVCAWTKNVAIPATGHNYVDGVCADCGEEKPVTDYYLFGFINGADYGCEGDYETIGEYLFVDGKLVVELTEGSYVGVKTGDNSKWFMTNGWQGFEQTSATLYDAGTLDNADKLYIPGKVEVTLTLTENEDGTLTLSYVAAEPEDPTLKTMGATLSFQDEIYYKIIFSLDNPDDVTVTEMGLLTWTSAIDGTVENAEYVIPGAEDYAGYLAARSQGIPARKMGEELYFKVYAKLENGKYVYSDLRNYSAKTYATKKLSNANTSEELKALCVALLNYGAAAQEYFSHNLDSFANDELTMSQQRLVVDYSAELLDDVVKADSSKTVNLLANGGFTRKAPSVNFGGAFAINYLFQPSYAVEGEMKLYVWDEATYNSVETLELSNATQVVTMSDNGDGMYQGRVSGIAAKNVDDTIYVCGVYEANGVTYYTGVLAYSLGTYCESLAAKTGSGQALAEATAVYCYYAKNYLEEA